MESSSSELPIAVVGAGIVGMATARAIQRTGRRVVVIDAVEPGRRTSFGNAGFIAIDHLLPLARLDILTRVPKMLVDRNSPLTIHLPSVRGLLPWMLRFGMASLSYAEVRKGIDALSAMMAEANAAWRSEIQYSGLGELFKTKGALYVYETEAGFRAGADERGLQRAKGIAHRILSGDEARELAPGLSRRIVRGVHYTDGIHTIDPYRVVARLAEVFAAEGGTIERRMVTGFTRNPDRRGHVASIDTDGGPIAVSGVVICSGRGSEKLARMLGFSAPLVSERGYHVMLEPDNVAFDVPVSPGERGFFITPMQDGLRLAGTVELGLPDQPESWHRADILKRHLADIFPGVGGAEKSRWMGERPSLPDFRPAIGPAPQLDNVWCAYGHQHVGLTLATVTARLIVKSIEGEPLPATLAACDPGRFG
jgi:D-amino-acid dehydrogenase